MGQNKKKKTNIKNALISNLQENLNKLQKFNSIFCSLRNVRLLNLETLPSSLNSRSLLQRCPKASTDRFND